MTARARRWWKRLVAILIWGVRGEVASAAMWGIVFYTSIPTVYAENLSEYKFQENQRRSLNKGEHWSIFCMDFDLEVEEKKVKVDGQMKVVQRNATIICHSEGNKKAYFTCRADSYPRAGNVEVWCE